MAERRIPFSVTDDDGVAHRGEIVIARSWRPDDEPDLALSFTIVLAQEPAPDGASPPESASVVICSPSVPVRLPASIAEAAATYTAGTNDSAGPVKLSRTTAGAFAEGRLVATSPLLIDMREVFAHGGRPKLELLARELIATGRRMDASWRTINEVLSWPRPPTRLTKPDKLRARLETTLARSASAPDNPGVAASIERLRTIANGGWPMGLAASVVDLKEDVALARCLSERPEEAAELIAMRGYLDAATPGPGRGALVVDHATTREQLSFVILLCEPHQLDRMRATFDVYQQSHAGAYAEHHQRYWRAFARLRALLHDAAPSAKALAQLNTISALGQPVGRDVLAEYERLTAERSACATTNLSDALRERPTCPTCHLSLDDGVPAEQADDVLRRIHNALGRQQQRLASEAVRRILARGGERLEQFLLIVQASDLAGLAQVLDDDLMTFLRELLSQPVAPTPEALDLFVQLARAYPSVSEDQLDAVIDTLRQLLTEKLTSQQADDPAHPAAFQLASLPPATS
ncbi:MAG: hypothetical protein WBD55_04835 [Dehalococcoidia bacterium]